MGLSQSEGSGGVAHETHLGQTAAWVSLIRPGLVVMLAPVVVAAELWLGWLLMPYVILVARWGRGSARLVAREVSGSVRDVAADLREAYGNAREDGESVGRSLWEAARGLPAALWDLGLNRGEEDHEHLAQRPKDDGKDAESRKEN
ncbi:MAG: hypothetical protein AAF682_00515 [Planctomycetota bacterium]